MLLLLTIHSIAIWKAIELSVKETELVCRHVDWTYSRHGPFHNRKRNVNYKLNKTHLGFAFSDATWHARWFQFDWIRLVGEKRKRESQIRNTVTGCDEVRWRYRGADCHSRKTNAPGGKDCWLEDWCKVHSKVPQKVHQSLMCLPMDVSRLQCRHWWGT